MCVAEIIEYFCRYTGRTTRMVPDRSFLCRDAQRRGTGVPGACRRGLLRLRPARLEYADPHCPCARCRSRLQERVARAAARRRDVILALAESVATDLLVAATNPASSSSGSTSAAVTAAAVAAAAAVGSGDVYGVGGGGCGDRDRDDAAYFGSSSNSSVVDSVSVGGISLATESSCLSSTSAATATTTAATITSIGTGGSSSIRSTVYTSPASSVASVVAAGMDQGMLKGQGGDKGCSGQHRGRMLEPGDSGAKRPKILLRRWGCLW